MKLARPIFTLKDMKKSAIGDIWQKEPFLNQQVLPNRRQTIHISGGEKRINVPMKKSISCHRFGPLLLEREHELAQGLHDVTEVHHGPLGHEVGVDEALLIEEGHHRQFAPDAMDLRLQRGCLGFFYKLF